MPGSLWVTQSVTALPAFEAADHRGAVWIGYVDSEGGTTRRLIEPVAVSGGAVAAFDRLRETMRTFALHRITAVAPAPTPDRRD